MSSSVTPNTSPTPGSTSRGTPTSTTSSARPSRRCHDRLDRRSARRARPARRWTRAARRTRRARRGSRSSGIGAAADPRGQLLGARRGAVGDDDLAHAGARRARAPCPRPSRPRRARAPAGRRATRAGSAASATAADGTDTGCRPMRGLGAGPLARPRPRGGTCATSSGPLADSCSARVPRLAHLAEDLALADDHRVEAGGDPEEVRDRGVVVVRVEEVGELVGVDARVVGEEVADVLHRRVEERGVGVDLGAVAGGEQHDLGEVLAPPTRTCSALGSPSGATAMRSSSSTGTVRWFRPTTTRDTPGAISLASSTRPARIRSSMPESKRRLPIGVLAGTPGGPQLFPGLRQQVEQGLVLGPELLSQSPPQPRGEGRAAPAGADGDHEVAPADDRHQRERAVRGVVGGVHPDPPGLARLEHRAVDRGHAGGGGGEPGAVEVGGLERPLGQRPAGRRRPRPAPRRRPRARPRATSAPAASSGSILRAAMRPAPTTTQRRPATTQVHRVPGDGRPADRRLVAHRPAGAAASPLRDSVARVGAESRRCW